MFIRSSLFLDFRSLLLRCVRTVFLAYLPVPENWISLLEYLY
jgi:hypothetical protein